MRQLVALDDPEPIQSHSELVYSTEPLSVLANDQRTYVLKGPALGIVFAEAVAYELANRVGLQVPPHGLCTVFGHDGPPNLYFACEKLEIRSGLEAVLGTGRVANPGLLADMIVLDFWIANDDRNVESVVARENGGSIYLYAIDFERAAVLNGKRDRFAVTAMQSKSFWPSEDMGRICAGRGIPEGICRSIENHGKDACAGVVEYVIGSMGLPEIPWKDAAVDLLDHRRRNLLSLIQEGWR